VRPIKFVLVKVPFGRIDNVPEGGRTPLHSRTTSVTQGGLCVYGVISGEQWSGIPPGTP
jgi:hypothetical protein